MNFIIDLLKQLAEAIERSAWWQTLAHLRKYPRVGTLGSI
jgi:hypothetical protein